MEQDPEGSPVGFRIRCGGPVSKGPGRNPSGRREGPGVRSSPEKVLYRKVTATVNGERRRVPLTDALVLWIGNNALCGREGT